MHSLMRRLLALFFAVILAVPQGFAASDDISRLYNFTAGDTIQSSQVNGELNQLVTTMNSKFGRGIANTLTGNNTFSGANTFSGITTFSNGTTGLKADTLSEYTGSAGVTIQGVGSLLKVDTITPKTAGGGVTFTEAIKPSVTADPTLAKGLVWFNSTSNLLKFYDGTTTQTVGTLSAAAFPTGYHGSAPPVYASATTFTVANIRERSNDDTVNITKAGSTTVTTSTSGLSGCTIGSANLTGTVTVSSGAAGVTFSSTQAGVLQIGDTITTAGGQVRRLSAGSGTSWTAESNWTSTETTVTVKRGGIGAKNTFYNLYAITDGTTPGLILSTRNVAGGDTLVDLPAGYSTVTVRQLPFAVRLDGSSNLLNFQVGEGWPYRPTILYNVLMTNSNTLVAGATNVLAAGTSATFVTITAGNSFMPPVSLKGILNVVNSSTANVSVLRTSSGVANSITAQNTYITPLMVTSAQAFDYERLTGAGSIYIDVLGYIVTEVP